MCTINCGGTNGNSISFGSESGAQRMSSLVIGVALTAIAAVATYFCIVNGLTLYDTATTSLAQFGAGFLIYSGVVFSVVAVGNALYTAGKQLMHEEGEKFEYSGKEAKWQIALSVLAPVAALPTIIVGGLMCALGGKR